MLKQDQVVKHDPPNSYGDCWRTTIANLIGVPRDDVPHLFHDGCDADTAFKRLNAWLRPRGLAFVGLGCTKAYLDEVGITGLYHLGGGRTERNTDHAAAFCDGELQHDPHPSHAGFVKMFNLMGMFVLLRPWEYFSSEKVGSNAGEDQSREAENLCDGCAHSEACEVPDGPSRAPDATIACGQYEPKGGAL